MPRAEMLTVFSYDIADDRRRRKVAAVLEERMVRVQESVFEARLDGADADRLTADCAAVMRPGDSLRVYAVARDGEPRCRQLGGPPLAEEQEFWLL